MKTAMEDRLRGKKTAVGREGHCWTLPEEERCQLVTSGSLRNRGLYEAKPTDQSLQNPLLDLRPE